MSVKTNAVRILENLGIAYEARSYDVDLEDLAAETVARKIGMPPEQVFKTLLLQGEKRGHYFAVIPGDAELDLKAAARLAGERRFELVPVKMLQGLTGYVRGGVTALAAKKDFPVLLDESASSFPRISISAGVRGTQILIAPADYVRATNAMCGRIARPKPGA